MLTENVSTLKIHKLTQEQYDRELAAGSLDQNALYLTPDEEVDLSIYATIDQLNKKADSNHVHDDKYYTEEEIDAKVDELNSSIEKITGGSTPVKEAEHAENADMAINANHAVTSDSSTSATSATSATKATQDGNGKVITDTYETKTDAQTKLDEAKDYTNTKTNGMATTTVVDNKIVTHNTSTSAHNDIRALISDLATEVSNFLDVDDTTRDQLSEVLTLIDNNKGTLDSLTTSKVNVADIINNLTTNVANKPLSAAQGVAIKALIDALQMELDTHETNKSNPHSVSLSQLGVTATAKELNYIDGVTKNVQAQLDEINSTLGTKFNDVVRVETANTDLNDYITNGIYYFGTEHTPANIPVGVNGWLIVIRVGTAIKQIWMRHGNPDANDHNTYVRLGTGSGSTWGEWTEYMTSKGGTMTGTLTVPYLVVNSTNTAPSVALRPNNATANRSSMAYDGGTNYRLYFSQYHPDQDSASTRYADAYTLPPSTEGKTKTDWYSILTSKNPVTIAQGGTGATNASTARDNLNVVCRAGDTMTGRLKTTGVDIHSDNWNSYAYYDSTGSNKRADLMLSDKNCFCFDQRETGASYADRYKLPDVTKDLTEDKWYNVLTSKNPVTIAQGGTGATTKAQAITNLGAMDLTSDQTVSGVKTFSKGIKVGTALYMVDDANVALPTLKIYNPTPDNPSSAGSELMVGTNGNVFIGSGESHSYLRNALSSEKTMLEGEYYNSGGERLYLSSDSGLFMYANCNSIGSRMGLGYNGSLFPLFPEKSNNLGMTSAPWTALYLGDNGKVIGRAATDLPTTDSNTTIPQGTDLTLLTYNSSGNLHLGATLYDKKITQGGTYISGASEIRLRTVDGSIVLSPNGNAKVAVSTDDTKITNTLYLANTADASGTSYNSPALVIGAKDGQHIEFDTNEIMSKTDGGTTGVLWLNTDGGTVATGGDLKAKGSVKVGSTGSTGGVLFTYDSTNECLMITFE